MISSRKLRKQTPGMILTIAAMLYSIAPLVSLFTAALAPKGSIPIGISWPIPPHWHNFIDAWNLANMTTLLKSSTIIVLGVVPFSVLISTMASYAVVILKIPFGRTFVMILLLTLTLPYELVIIPLYYQEQSMGILGTQFGLILALIGLNMPFAVFWMRTHFLSVPAELTEAAQVDGLGPLTSFIWIQLPLARPAIAALSMLMFLSTWNSFLLPLVLINNPNQRTMAGALQAFVTQYSTNEVLLNAGALLMMAPTIIVFLLLQKYFVKALLQGAIKG